MRFPGAFAGSPRRFHHGERRAIEPDDLVRILSRDMALGAWEETVESTVGLSNLWTACEWPGLVRDASAPLEAVWGSLSHEEKRWVAVCACTGNVFHAEWPGIPRVTTHEADRVNKLKALGNSIVPQVAYELLMMLLEVDDAPAPAGTVEGDGAR
jgi:hypothetical protein